MGLLQKAVETYDAHAALTGQVEAGHVPLAPIGHVVTSAQIEIVLDRDGKFIGASAVDKSESKIVIPVSEESAGRTSGACAHPLCDQLCYLAPYNAEKHSLYLKQLTEWTESEDSHPKLLPILKYIRSGSILSDLSNLGLIELADDQTPKKEKDLVRWRVIGMDDGCVDACWMDKSLFEAYIRFDSHRQRNNETDFCMVTGEIARTATQHAKGIIPLNGNAKLISSNDDKGFTFRGRFSDDTQAATVSFDASQKAHNALKWLAAEQGIQVIFGGRTFLCWNPHGKTVCGVTGPFRKSQTVLVKPSDYRKELKETLAGFRTELPDAEDVVIAVFDAATSGRLAVTYYNELRGSDFLQRLYEWDLNCCWNEGKNGIQSPPLRQIVDCAYGTQRKEKGTTDLYSDDRILRQQMQRLVSCRIDRALLPLDLVKALVNRASSPQAYDDAVWRKIVITACAVLNKYENEKKGQIEMPWELDKQDRSFQFGRLLAAMERAELDFYQKTGEEPRQTTAIKAMAEFRQRPWSTYERINFHLNQAYLPRIELWQRQRYARLRDEIMGVIRNCPENELNRPLNDIYLMGYDLQHAEFYKKHNNQDTQEVEK